MPTKYISDYQDALDKLKDQGRAITIENIHSVMGKAASVGSVQQIVSEYHRQLRVAYPDWPVRPAISHAA